jgi:predicted DNA-binding protein (MmcQ/YjbR family)
MKGNGRGNPPKSSAIATPYTSSMDVERLRTFLLTLPHVVETEQWGGLVFWVGDKAIGGKMFVMLPLEQESAPSRILSYPAGPERYHELLEIEGVFPAPYVARIHWVAVERWNVFRTSEWEHELRAAHALTLVKLTPRTRAILAMPTGQQKRLIAERRKLLAAKATSKTR